MLYDAQVFSHVNYGIGIWGNLVNKQILCKFQKIQNKCLSYILHHKRINDKNFTNLRILKINEIIKLDNLKFAYKYYHGHLPLEINKNVLHDHLGNSLLKKHRYSTRGKNNLTTPLVKNHKYLNSILCKSVQEYHTLKGETKNLPTIHSFTRTCKNEIAKGRNNCMTT